MSVTRGDLGMLFGLAGLLLGGGAFYSVAKLDRDVNGQNGVRAVMATDGEHVETLAERATSAVEAAEKLREDLSAANLRISGLRRDLDAMTQRANGLETRLGILESK